MQLAYFVIVLCAQTSSHMHRHTCSIKKLFYASYTQFPSTLETILADFNTPSEIYEASKQECVTNSTRRNAHDSSDSTAHDFTNPQNKHHDKLKEFRLYFWKGK